VSWGVYSRFDKQVLLTKYSVTRDSMSRLTIENALARLNGHEGPFKEIFSHGSLTIEIYKPVEIDHQQPHTRDEIYVIATGSGIFVKGGRSQSSSQDSSKDIYQDSERQKFEKGEVIFVPAGMVHRFENFSDDFSTWVFFYGPEGGEASSENE
jgi:mannose-6-phosphate isomerase-like protein (cupin superfamily)